MILENSMLTSYEVSTSMFFLESPAFVNDYVDALSSSLGELHPGAKLSTKQKNWLSFCLTGISVTNSVCWARFERASLKQYQMGALSYMFRHSPIHWEALFHASIAHLLSVYGISSGVLLYDDTDNQRAKVTTRIHKAFKVFDKKSGGYFNGQTIVFLVLVTNTITIPVGFRFYHPDPKWKEWEKNDEALRNAGVPKEERPPKPSRSPEYPTKLQLVEEMLQEFKSYHSTFVVRALIGDNYFSKSEFMDCCGQLFNCQTISQLKKNQKVKFRNRELQIQEYFKRYEPVPTTIQIRGDSTQKVYLGGARLHVKSHGCKRFVIALKYEGEEEYRYIVATDMSWRAVDVTETFTLRWLVEVFIEDFKSYEGWGQLAKQPGVEGSVRGLSLSLLLDHCLLLHPSQRVCLKNKIPANTVGSLLRRVKAECLLDFLKPYLIHSSKEKEWKALSKTIEELYELNCSGKHMSGRELGRQNPTDSLKYRAARAA